MTTTEKARELISNTAKEILDETGSYPEEFLVTQRLALELLALEAQVAQLRVELDKARAGL